MAGPCAVALEQKAVCETGHLESEYHDVLDGLREKRRFHLDKWFEW